MSEAKREHSQYHRLTAVGRVMARATPAPAKFQLTQEAGELRLLESWETTVPTSGDPYNGVGTRAVRGRGLHK